MIPLITPYQLCKEFPNAQISNDIWPFKIEILKLGIYEENSTEIVKR